jgi:hypothetical protein
MTRLLFTLLLVVASVGAGAAEPAQLISTVRVFVPGAVLFNVPDVSVETTASGSSTLSFDSGILVLGQVLRVSVRTDGDLTIPSGPPIPASNVFWTTSNAVNGVGFNGTLSKTVYTPVYQSNVGVLTGRVDLTWKLAAPGGGIMRSGTRNAALRWRFESVSP